MVVIEEVKQILDGVLQLNGNAANFSESTLLLGNIPEFDSMAVVSIITSIEDSYGVVVDDDEIDAEVFETLGSLAAFVESKI